MDLKPYMSEEYNRERARERDAAVYQVAKEYLDTLSPDARVPMKDLMDEITKDSSRLVGREKSRLFDSLKRLSEGLLSGYIHRRKDVNYKGNEVERFEWSGKWRVGQQPCPRCGGTGKIDEPIKPGDARPEDIQLDEAMEAYERFEEEWESDEENENVA